MLKKSHYYALKFSPGSRIFWKLEYKWVPDSQWPHVVTSVSFGEAWGSRLSRIFLHRKPEIQINSDVFIYLFSREAPDFRYFDLFPGIFLTIMLA